MIILETERLILRNFIRADQESFQAVRADQSPAAAAREAKRYMDSAAEIPRRQYQLAVLDRKDGELVGHTGIELHAIGQTTANFNCEIAPACRGKGFACEASRAVLDLGFKSLGLTYIGITTEVADEQALRLLTRLGMRPERAEPGRFAFWRREQPALHGISKSDWNRPAS